MKSLEEILSTCDADKNGKARCKAHGGKNRNLEISRGADGRTLFKCWSRDCSFMAILDAYGLEPGDVLPDKPLDRRSPTPPPESKTSWDIRDSDGRLVTAHILLPTRPGNKKQYTWKTNGKTGLDGIPTKDLPLYRTEFVKDFDLARIVVLCEGEKATDAAVKLGMQALGTVCGASSAPGRDSLKVLIDAKLILWPDWDKPGMEHMGKIAEVMETLAESVRWIRQPDAGPKDDAADYTGTLSDLQKAVQKNAPILGSDFEDFADGVTAALEEARKVSEGDLSDYVSTGVPSLDAKLMGGWRRGHVILIGAPSGAGKTTLVQQFAMVAQDYGRALVVSPEMTIRELVGREIIRRSGKPRWQVTPRAFPQTRADAMQLQGVAAESILTQRPNVHVYKPTDDVTLEKVFLAARVMHEQSPLSMVCLDYAQQLADMESTKARHILVGQVATAGLKMAREFNCPVIITSQINVFKEGKVKSYSFRESQVLEHKAHVVLLFLVERDDYGKVSEAKFRATKARESSLFSLEVEYIPELFTIADLNDDKGQNVLDYPGGRE